MYDTQFYGKWFASFLILFSLFQICLGQVQISGQVFDQATKAPLEGATVLLKGEQVGTLTDESGKFSLEVPDLNRTLLISYSPGADQSQ